MIALIGIFAVVVLAALFLLFRSAGRFGQQPSAQERMRHNGGNASLPKPGPRAPGIN
jgi:hypothetical protein